MLTERRVLVRNRKSHAKTKVGNGSTLLEKIDGRTFFGRRVRELLLGFIADMGGDPSGAQDALARRASVMIAWCEKEEQKLADPELEKTFEVVTYIAMVNAMRRLLYDIGLERRARDVTPDLRRYLEAAKKPESTRVSHATTLDE